MKSAFLVDTHPVQENHQRKASKHFRCLPTALFKVRRASTHCQKSGYRTGSSVLVSLQIGDTPAGQLIPLLPLSRYYGAAALV